MNIVLTCGGTGGHINPAIAVAKMLRERHPDCRILFIGSDGMEQDLVPREGFVLKKLKVSGFERKLTVKNLFHNIAAAWNIADSLRRARKILRDFQADVVVGTGGYASFPALRAGAKLGIPTAVHESNAIPGLTTRMVAEHVDKIMVSFPSCRENYANKEKVVVTGTPVRDGFLYCTRAQAREKLGLDDRPVIVSCWGSLGAREMNKIIAGFMCREAEHDEFQHIHATGSYGWRWMPEHVKKLGLDLSQHPNIDMREYIYDMPAAMAAADLVICRAGAATISEITVSGTPAIIVPSPNVAENHQEKNARVLAEAGAAVVLLEKDCTDRALYEEAAALLRDPERLKSMRNALAQLAVVDSTERICRLIMDLAKAHR